MKKLAFLLSLLSAFAFQLYAQENKETNIESEISPRATYTRLFRAVRAKNTEAIKNEMSRKTQEFAESVAKQKKQTVEQIYKNGFFASTITEKLPKMRQQIIKDKFAILEVWVEKDKKWEDVYFVSEDGYWKIAVGEYFADTFKSPGKTKSQLEREKKTAMMKPRKIH
jgi:hypothetical protein